MGNKETLLKEGFVEVSLKCGRVEMNDSVGFDSLAGYPGSCETNTNNQTIATCC